MKQQTVADSIAPGSENTSTRDLIDFSRAPPDSPAANANRAVRLFCESGSSPNRDEEVLHLPVIVEAAESSPAAAAACAHRIRKFLTNEWSTKPQIQYNALMLIRILSDNPGPSFTRNFDKAFVSTVKSLLRSCRDRSTQTILRETLDSLEANKGYDEGVQRLLQMWRREKGSNAHLSASADAGGSRGMSNGQNGAWQTYPPQGLQTGYPNGSSMNGGYARNQLPPPVELANRIEEARNTANILLQLTQSTPAQDLMSNELVKEFSERCQTAQKSMQSYCNCNNPPPDDDTLQTLIETNEQLSLAGSRYQRALLAARRARGSQVATPPALPEQRSGYVNGGSTFAAPNQKQSYVPPIQPQDEYGPSGYFQQPQQAYAQPNDDEDYQPPPGPPPHIAGSLQSRSPPPPQQHYQISGENPFEDPDESLYDNRPPQQQRQHSNHNFAIDATSPSRHTAAAPSMGARRNTLDLENAYSMSYSPAVSSPSPTLTRDGKGSEAGLSEPRGSNSGLSEISPQLTPQDTRHSSGPRPGPGPWHNSGVTPSYVGRQSSALNGLTMHGAGSGEEIAELDGGFAGVKRR